MVVYTPVISDATMVGGTRPELPRLVVVLPQHFAAVPLPNYARESYTAPLQCSRL